MYLSHQNRLLSLECKCAFSFYHLEFPSPTYTGDFCCCHLANAKFKQNKFFMLVEEHPMPGTVKILNIPVCIFTCYKLKPNDQVIWDLQVPKL